MIFFKLYLLLCTLFSYSHSANILGVFQAIPQSHFILGSKLLKSLAEKGHNVTMLAPFKMKNPSPNWKHVYLDNFLLELRKDSNLAFEFASMPNYAKILTYNSFGYLMTSECLQHPKVQELLASNETFDLIIIEKFYNEALLGLAYHFKAPYIILSTVGSSRWINEIVGNPGSPAYVPDLFLDYHSVMNYWQRLHNTLFYIYAEFYRHYIMFPKNQALLDQYFPGAILEDLYYNASLILLNSHLSLSAAVPSVPNMIDIGGFHIDPPKKLPEDLQIYLDNAKEGVIYFSLGSVTQSKGMPETTRNAILRTFSKLKQRVLWKWEGDAMPNQPPNVKLSKWFPQQDVLAHPNVVLFITHCGLLSTTEAVYHGIPLVGLPLFADQKMNAAILKNNGYGISIVFQEITEENFAAAINEILSNPKYRDNVQRRSRILHDQLSTPLERAVFWSEYVIRHKGAPQLRSVTLNLKWYQYLLLDVVAFIIGLILISATVLTYLIKWVCRSKQSKFNIAKKRN